MDMFIHITTPHLKVLLPSEDNHLQQLNATSAHMGQSLQLGNGSLTIDSQSPAAGVLVNMYLSTDTIRYLTVV